MQSQYTGGGQSINSQKSANSANLLTTPITIASNQQIASLCRRSIDDYYRVCRLLSKFITGNKNDRIRFVSDLTTRPESDSSIYFRMQPRMKTITDTYDDHLQMAHRIKKLTGDFLNSNMKYIDVGCGQVCEKTRAIGETLGLSKPHIWGTDIATWMGREHVTPSVNFKMITNDRLDFNDNEFDIATCLMVLHHLTAPRKTIAEIARILKPRGIVVIREHDAHTNADRAICDIEHMAYAAARINTESRIDFEREYQAKCAEYYGSYYSYAEIAQLMADGGFEAISGPVFGNVEYTDIAVNRAYLAVFRKL